MNQDEMLRLDRIAGLSPDQVTDPKDVEVLASLRSTQVIAAADALREQIERDGTLELINAVRDIDLVSGEGPGEALINGLTERKAPAAVVFCTPQLVGGRRDQALALLSTARSERSA